jgi:hypothetical protein
MEPEPILTKKVGRIGVITLMGSPSLLAGYCAWVRRLAGFPVTVYYC